jgi:hypothetical protein
VVTRRAKRLNLAAQERACRLAVKKRDKGRCVLCKCKSKSVHLHHIVYRSRGGKWTPQNVISVCAWCHGMIHAGKITVTGTATRLVWSL